jgi:hypothetical protein
LDRLCVMFRFTIELVNFLELLMAGEEETAFKDDD